MNKILKQILSILLCLLLVACNAQSTNSSNAEVSTDNEIEIEEIDNSQTVSEEKAEEDKLVGAYELDTTKALVLGDVPYNVIDVDVTNNIVEVTRSYLSEDSKTYFSDIDGPYASIYEGSLVQQYMNDYYNNLPSEVKEAIVPEPLGTHVLGHIIVEEPNMIWQEPLFNQYVYPYRTEYYDDNGHDSWTIKDGASAILEGCNIESISRDSKSPEYYYWSTLSHRNKIVTIGTYYSESEQEVQASSKTMPCDVECYNRPTFKIKLINVHKSQVIDKPYWLIYFGSESDPRYYKRHF